MSRGVACIRELAPVGHTLSGWASTKHVADGVKVSPHARVVKLAEQGLLLLSLGLGQVLHGLLEVARLELGADEAPALLKRHVAL